MLLLLHLPCTFFSSKPLPHPVFSTSNIGCLLFFCTFFSYSSFPCPLFSSHIFPHPFFPAPKTPVFLLLSPPAVSSAPPWLSPLFQCRRTHTDPDRTVTLWCVMNDAWCVMCDVPNNMLPKPPKHPPKSDYQNQEIWSSFKTTNLCGDVFVF